MGGAVPLPTAMQTAAVVVDEKVIGVPVVTVDELRLGAPLKQFPQKGAALLCRPADYFSCIGPH